MSQPSFIDTATVANLMGLPSADAFLVRRLELEKHHHFPLPLPWWKRPFRWRRDQIEHWIEQQGTPESPEERRAKLIAHGIQTGKVALLERAAQP